jgi:hypothetical protein
MSCNRPRRSLADRLRLARARNALQRNATDGARRLCLVGGRKRWSFVFLVLLAVLRSNDGHAQQTAIDKDAYASAAEQCRGTASRPMTLSADHGVLCFDGWISENLDLTPAKDLKESGLFVVRSYGGYPAAAIALSNLLRERHATVVVYDHCLAACASYFFFASSRTYVLRGALVAWRASAAHLVDCAKAGKEGGFVIHAGAAPQLPCPVDISEQDLAGYLATRSADARFYAPRKVHPVLNRDSPYITRLLQDRFAETGVYPNVMWTLSPKLRNILKTEITYEAYPASQAEVDAIAQGVRITFPVAKVIYDP